MKKLLLLTFLSLTIANNITSKQFSFELNSENNQVDLSDMIGGSLGMFEVEFLYIENPSYGELPNDEEDILILFTSNFNPYESEDGEQAQGAGTVCRLNNDEDNPEIIICKYDTHAEGLSDEIYRFFINDLYSTITYYEFQPDGCLGDCNINSLGTVVTRVTGPFDDEVGSSDEIDELQAQIDELTAQLEGCVDCQGDLNDDETISVSDIVMLVEHILEGEGDCYSQ